MKRQRCMDFVARWLRLPQEMGEAPVYRISTTSRSAHWLDWNERHQIENSRSRKQKSLTDIETVRCLNIKFIVPTSNRAKC